MGDQRRERLEAPRDGVLRSLAPFREDTAATMRELQEIAALIGDERAGQALAVAGKNPGRVRR
jgi:hypothetical protein